MSDGEVDRTLTVARQRRQDYLDRLHPYTQSNHSEHERESRDDDRDEVIEDECPVA